VLSRIGDSWRLPWEFEQMYGTVESLLTLHPVQAPVMETKDRFMRITVFAALILVGVLGVVVHLYT